MRPGTGASMACGTTILTVGHGTASAAAFAALVVGAGITAVIDVRRFPGSRRHPHFAMEDMGRWLPEHGVAYRWLPALGGRRRSSGESSNVGLRNLQFRAYADHMASDEFADGVRALLATVDEGAGASAVMCSESVWWRCHRRLIADHLVLVEGVPVEHVFHDGRRAPHGVTAGSRRAGAFVVYDAVG